MLYEDDENILDEMQEWKSKRTKDFSTIVNKKKVSKFEMDDYFVGG